MSPDPPADPAEHRIELRGRGAVEVAAYGLADAEHLVEKELGRLWPEARVEVTGVERAGGPARIAEEMRVSYRIGCGFVVRAADAAAARREAFRHARARLAGSRYWRTEWEVPAPGGRGGR